MCISPQSIPAFFRCANCAKRASDLHGSTLILWKSVRPAPGLLAVVDSCVGKFSLRPSPSGTACVPLIHGRVT